MAVLARPELIIGALTVRSYPRRPIVHLVNIAVGLASVSFCVLQRSAMHHSEVLGRFFYSSLSWTKCPLPFPLFVVLGHVPSARFLFAVVCWCALL